MLSSVLKRVLAALTLVFFVHSAHAECILPSLRGTPPEPPSAKRPPVHECLLNYKFLRKHDCKQEQQRAYEEAIKNYLQLLQNYANEGRQFAQASASDYAQQVSDYANCEAEAVRKQHE